MRFKKTCVTGLISLLLLVFAGPASFAKGAKTQSITVAVGSDCTCGNHAGGFDTLYKGKKISVGFEFNANRANPIAHPLKVFKGKSEIKDWDGLLCPPTPSPGNAQLSGKRVIIEGRFKDGKNFDAYKIYVQP